MFTRQKIIICVMFLLCAAGLVFGTGTKEKNFNFGGSTTVLPIIESAIESFQAENPGITISYEGQGSSVGIKGVIEGIYSLGGSSRNIKQEEKEAGAVGIAIALDGIAVIVNRNVLMDNLTLEDVAKIYTGKITNWGQLGGADSEIVIVNRDEASGTRATFSELVLDEILGKKKEKFIVDAIITESNGDMVIKVGSTPDSIGYCGFGYIEKTKNTGGKAVSINGIKAEVKNVTEEKYPISRKLWVVSKGPCAKDSIEKKFVDFILSKEGQAIVKDEGFIPLP